MKEGVKKRRYFPTFTQRWKRVKWKIPSRFFIFLPQEEGFSQDLKESFFWERFEGVFYPIKFFLLVKKCNKHMTLAWSEELVLLITFRCNSPHNMIFKAAMYMRPTSTMTYQLTYTIGDALSPKMTFSALCSWFSPKSTSRWWPLEMDTTHELVLWILFAFHSED